MERIVRKVMRFPQPITWTENKNVYRQVAVYARVSTNKDDQLESVEAQKDYYTKYISGRSDWMFAGLYSDQGLSGTSYNKRKEFNRMITDALMGRFDLIITKSISRFARNTVDTLKTTRKLKEHGVEVYFEKEDIWSMDSKGEFFLTMLSSIAQEESRSISENVAWGIRKKFADGVYSVPYAVFLGYDKSAYGELTINENEAAVVRKIYSLFLHGMTPVSIAKKLTAEGIATPGGKENWQPRTIHSILTNEKYKGDALLQKKYTADFLTKKQRLNKGELPQYYIEADHEPIIAPTLFDYVQGEFKRRLGFPVRYSGALPFSSKIICGDCGGFYGAKRWHSTSPGFNNLVWQCNSRYDHEGKCRTAHLYHELLQYACACAMLHLLANRAILIQELQKFISNTIAAEPKRIQCIKQFIHGFSSMPIESLVVDESDCFVIIKNITVNEDRALLFQFADGSDYEFVMPKFSPKRRPLSSIQHADTGEKTMREIQKEQITFLRTQGHGYGKIAETLDIPKETVKSYCKRNSLGGVKAGNNLDAKTILPFCKQCGNPIKQKSGQKMRKFCCDRCRQIWWNIHPDKVVKKAIYTFTCQHCGAEFSSYGNAERKYCSHECYIAERFGNK